MRYTAILVLVLLTAATWAEERFDGDKVVRVRIETIRDLRTMLALSDDPWSHGVGIGDVDFRVSAAALAAMNGAGLRYEVLIDDVQALIDAEKARLNAGGVAGDDWFGDFKNWQQVNDRLVELAALRPDIATTFTVGTSIQNRAIRGLKLSTGPNRPAVLFDGCQHAREWIAVMVPMYLADRLTTGYGVDAQVTDLLNQVDVIIVPIVNPDGYVYSWDVDRLWRKNRRQNPGGSFGVDNNRNWGFMWGGEGASANPASETYRGTAPFSEPETAAMRDLFLANPQIVATIDFHSYGQWILYPWGWTVDLPPDAPVFQGISTNIRENLLSVHGTPYVDGPIYTLLYPASGGSVDWSYGDQAAWAWTIELRDKGEFGFILPPDQIIPTAEENWVAALGLIEQVANAILFTFPDGLPSQIEANESTTLVFDVAGVTDIDIFTPSIGAWWRQGTTGDFLPATVSATDDGSFAIEFPASPCGALIQFYLEAANTNGGWYRWPTTAPDDVFELQAVTSFILFDDAMESDLGWSLTTPGDTATSGKWVRVNPNGTTAQPEDDHTERGTICHVTGQGAVGGAEGAADVDGGTTTLTSPVFDGRGDNTVVRYWRWYSNDQGQNPNQDSMLVEISSDAGDHWSPLETVTDNTGAWVERSFTIADFAEPTAAMRIRFVARDLNPASLVEAGVDDFSVVDALCADGLLGDVNSDGSIDGADLGLLLAAWETSDAASDFDGNGVVDGADLGILLCSWAPC
jgi:hypothetical protein